MIFELFRERLEHEEHVFSPVWKKLPYSESVPDHSTWHHNTLLSALSTCPDYPYIVSVSVGPVQRFTLPALRIKEYTRASLVFSYLLWSGTRTVCDELGPDHIISGILILHLCMTQVQHLIYKTIPYNRAK